MASLYFMKCGQKLPLPFHCGQPIHKEKVEEKEKLVCWLGPQRQQFSVSEKVEEQRGVG